MSKFDDQQTVIIPKIINGEYVIVNVPFSEVSQANFEEMPDDVRVAFGDSLIESLLREVNDPNTTLQQQKEFTQVLKFFIEQRKEYCEMQHG